MSCFGFLEAYALTAYSLQAIKEVINIEIVGVSSNLIKLPPESLHIAECSKTSALCLSKGCFWTCA